MVSYELIIGFRSRLALDALDKFMDDHRLFRVVTNSERAPDGINIRNFVYRGDISCLGDVIANYKDEDGKTEDFWAEVVNPADIPEDFSVLSNIRLTINLRRFRLKNLDDYLGFPRDLRQRFEGLIYDKTRDEFIDVC